MDTLDALLDQGSISPQTHQMAAASILNDSARMAANGGARLLTGVGATNPLLAGAPDGASPDADTDNGPGGGTPNPAPNLTGTPQAPAAPALPPADVPTRSDMLMAPINAIESVGKGIGNLIAAPGEHIANTIAAANATTPPSKDTPASPLGPAQPGGPGAPAPTPGGAQPIINPFASLMQDTGIDTAGLTKGYNQEIAGAQAEAAAQASAAKQVSAITQQAATTYAQQSAANEVIRQKGMAQLQDDLATLDKQNQEIAQTKIDPDHFWATRSTGQRISAAIGLALGGFGAAMTHTPDVAAQLITDAINRDVDAQKANYYAKSQALSNRYSAFKVNADLFNNDQVARQAALVNGLTVAKMNVDAATQLAQGPVALARAQQLSGQLGVALATAKNDVAKTLFPMRMQMAQFQEIEDENKAAAGGTTTPEAVGQPKGLNLVRREQFAFTPQNQQQFVGLTQDGRGAVAPSPTAAEKAQDINAAHTAALSDIDNYLGFVAQHPVATLVPGSPDRATAETLANNMRRSILSLSGGSVRPNEGSLKYGDITIPGTGLIENLTGQEGLVALRRQIATDRISKLSAYLPLTDATKQYLINPNAGAAPSIYRSQQPQPGT